MSNRMLAFGCCAICGIANAAIWHDMAVIHPYLAVGLLILIGDGD